MEQSVQQPHLNRLGVPARDLRLWTPWEREQLRAHLGTIGYRALALRLKRTVSACKIKARELGLTRKWAADTE